jgi:hypothetical protein
MHHNPVVLGLHSRLFPATQAIGIFAVNHFDMMPFRDQCASQCLHKGGIAPEMVGWIKCGDHTKAHLLFPGAFRRMTQGLPVATSFIAS